MKLVMQYYPEDGQVCLVDKDKDPGVPIICIPYFDPPDNAIAIIDALKYVGVEVEEEDVWE